eukprot:TRINITY_DN33364_c0_g1_i2.p1 TRINITY_DN33364_c0_g1~~TRINITY_DN33364_c0_g1_i2.p1  ORF type:complete len:500 (+),score=148.33 TRINITY_DN33364_c0_g1_i2:53-1501(+)
MASVQALKSLFEDVYATKCGSYFEDNVDNAAGAVAFKVHTVHYGSGAGYNGDPDETSLEGMKAKHLQRTARDDEFVALFNDLAKTTNDLEANSDVNFIVAYLLREASFAEMTEQRLKLFEALLQMLQVIASNEKSLKMLAPSNRHGNIVDLLKVKKDEGVTYIKCAKGQEDEIQNAQKVQEAIESVLKCVASPEEAKYDASSNEIKTADPTADEIRSWLASKKFSFASGIQASSTLKKYDNGEAISKQKLQRMKKEISILSNSLPDGIFVKVDDERFDFMQVMIIGPQGTPYENGCFMFDLYLPSGFPQSCPKMNFLTTGGGSFYFNPNLYQDGKVCLSLLGTWEGPGWNSETSSLLQLLVSLQALVFVDFPLENEPGYEGRADKKESLNYNNRVRYATLLYAMTWYFTNPDKSVHFVDEAKLHLFANKQAIAEQLESWKEKNNAVSNSCSYFSWKFSSPFDTMATALLAQLEAFPQGVKLE